MMQAELDYVPLSVSGVQALTGLDPSAVEVYLPHPAGREPVLYHRPGSGSSAPDFERVRKHGVPLLFLRSADFQRLGCTMEDKLKDIVTNPTYTASDKSQIAQQIGHSVAKELIDVPESDIAVDRAANVVDSMIDGMWADPAVGSYLMQMTSHDQSTAGHMFAVSMLAVVLGAEVFGADRAALKALGLAGMLHDLGKLAIPSQLLQKPGPPTREELQLIQQHPIESVRLIGDDPMVSPSVRQMIIQHHERLDGRGYPLGVGCEELQAGSRILSIVDSFHAIVGQRPYRKPIAPVEANRLLKQQSGKQFDSDFLACWLDLFDKSMRECGPDRFLSSCRTSEEVSSRHEHRPDGPCPDVVGPRQRRYECKANTKIRCVYAGRLQDVSDAPSEFAAVVLDVSKNGLCLKTEHPMFRGEVINVHISGDGTRVWVRAIVAWCHQNAPGDYRIGVQFEQRMAPSDALKPARVTPLPVD